MAILPANEYALTRLSGLSNNICLVIASQLGPVKRACPASPSSSSGYFKLRQRFFKDLKSIGREIQLLLKILKILKFSSSPGEILVSVWNVENIRNIFFLLAMIFQEFRIELSVKKFYFLRILNPKVFRSFNSAKQITLLVVKV